MAGLADYFTNDTGLYGAALAGEQRGRDRAAADLKALYAMQDRPLEQEKLRLGNEGLAAANEAAALTNQVNRSQVGNKIAAANTAFDLDQDTAKLKQQANYGQKISAIAAQLKAVPPLARGAAFRQMAAEAGIGLDNPRAQQFLNTDPNKLPDLLNEIGTGMATSSAEHIRKMAEEKQKQDAEFAKQKYASDSSASASRYVADKGFEKSQLSTQAKSDFLGSLRKAADPVKQYGMLQSEATRIQDTDPVQAGIYRQMATSIEPVAQAKIKSATPGAVDMNALGMQTQAAPSIAPVQQRPAPGTPDIAQAVKAAGQAYEPEKYEYRIAPDGRVQRKPK